VKIKFTPSARTQFFSGLSYIHKDKPSAAINFRNRVEKILRRLEDFPESHMQQVLELSACVTAL
jgi:plasmid stabilization system protein ParE